VKSEHNLSWLKDRRVRGTAIGCLITGFLLGMVIFGAPWHLPPDWGDIPTWLLAVVGAVAGWAALRQLQVLQRQVKEEADRNVKRDELIQSQLNEVRSRERIDRRRQAEKVELRAYPLLGNPRVFVDVKNSSARPIADITCCIMSSADGKVIAVPDEQPGTRYDVLPSGSACKFTLNGWSGSQDEIFVAWFTDDAGFRWQLGGRPHLVETESDNYIR
jgi:hypothetical protein